MFTLCVKDSFSAAHRLENYGGKCEELHGHNFLVEVFFEGERLDECGMLVDFKVLKGYLKNVLDKLDHKYINEIPFFHERASSSEFIAMYIFHELKMLIKEGMISLKEVRVWESENVYAAYGD
ncbi:MAG: 6-carboxytetrahydropterin synthase QueD [Proteobacteria bacterium]|jgi:6-pyruvoyltetrahydropterin/6-carboxytetrahydropterin synthase|nr:6-carboxytetrahydropterin synthase QueD [Pseudomonadota bacterium]